MTGRDKINAALNHRSVSGVPIDFGATPVTGMHVQCVAALRKHYGLDAHPVKVTEPYQMLGEIEPDLMDVLGIDAVGVGTPGTMFGFENTGWKPWRTLQGLEVLVPGKFNATIDAEGNVLMYTDGDTNTAPCAKMPAGGYFFDAIIRQEPLDEEHLDSADNLEEFQPVSEKILAYYGQACAAAAATGRAVVANFGGTALGDIALVPGLMLKHPKGIRDITEWYISTLTRQDFVHAIFEEQTRIALSNLERLYAVVQNNADVVFICGTDFGTQDSTFCSLDTFHSLYLPYYRRINDWIHTHTPWKTFKHSCGSVITLLDAFIEAGFDIINPVQCTAAGMVDTVLKEQFGDRLTFWGGGIDTQTVLPFGSPADIRKQILHRCEVFNRDGGFVFNSIHNVQANTPVENLIALCEAVRAVNER